MRRLRLRDKAARWGAVAMALALLGVASQAQQARFTTLTVDEQVGIRVDLSVSLAGITLPKTGLVLGLGGDILSLGGNVTLRKMRDLAPGLEKRWREPGPGEEPGKLAGIYWYLVTAFIDDKESIQEGPIFAWTERPDIYIMIWEVPDLMREAVRLGAQAGYRVYRYYYGPFLLAVIELLERGEIEPVPFSQYRLVREFVLSGGEYAIRFEDNGRLREGAPPNLTPTGILTVEGAAYLQSTLAVTGLTAMGQAPSWSARLNLAPYTAAKDGRPLVLSFDNSTSEGGVWSWAIHPVGTKLNIPVPEKGSPPTVVSFVEQFPAERGWTTVSRMEFEGPAGNIVFSLGNPVAPLGPANAGTFTVTDRGLAYGGATRLAVGVGGTDVQVAIGSPEVPLGVGQPYVPATAGSFTITDFSARNPRLIVSTAGNVGLGTAAPLYRLHIADLGATPASLALDSAGLPRGRTWTLTSAAAGDLVVELAGAPGGAYCAGAPRFEMSPTGAAALGIRVPAAPPGSLTIAHSLGVGQVAPAGCGDIALAGSLNAGQNIALAGNLNVGKNAVVGAQLKLGVFPAAPPPVGAGALYFDTTRNQVMVFDGANWLALAAGPGPAGPPGPGIANVQLNVNPGAAGTPPAGTANLLPIPGSTNQTLVLNLQIPPGPQGPQGPQGPGIAGVQLNVGSLPAGQPAAGQAKLVPIAGSNNQNLVLNLQVPEGAPGIPGAGIGDVRLQVSFVDHDKPGAGLAKLEPIQGSPDKRVVLELKIPKGPPGADGAPGAGIADVDLRVSYVPHGRTVLNSANLVSLPGTQDKRLVLSLEIPEPPPASIDLATTDTRYVQKTGDRMTGTLRLPELEASGQVFGDWLVVGEPGFTNCWAFINPNDGPDLALGPVEGPSLAKLTRTVLEFSRSTGLVRIGNDLEVGKRLTVSGSAELTGDVLVGGKLDLLGPFTARTARIGGTLQVDGATTLATASVSGDLEVGGNADILGVLTVADATELMSTLQVGSWVKAESFAFAKWLVVGASSGNLANSWGVVRTPGEGAGTLTIGAFVTAAEAGQGKLHVPVLSMTSASMTANWPTTFLRGVTVGRGEAPANLVVYGDLTVHGIKFFAQPHPEDPASVIAYAALEGPEAGTYIRGTAQLVNGEATIELPEHFALVTSAEGLTVQVTLLEDCNGLYVAEKSPGRIVVKELRGGTSNARFDYLVQGVRKGYESLAPVRPAVEVGP